MLRRLKNKLCMDLGQTWSAILANTELWRPQLPDFGVKCWDFQPTLANQPTRRNWDLPLASTAGAKRSGRKST